MRRATEVDYNIIYEDDRVLTCPEETKNHVEEYFKNLYQARPGTPEYANWTQHITDTVHQATEKTTTTNSQGSEPLSLKELNKAIKKLKRKKSLGPDEIPNEIFIEGNKTVRNTILKIFNRIHTTEDIPTSWLQGEIIRLYKGKGKKGKCSNERGITLASNVGKLYERIINETACGYHECPSWRHTGQFHRGPFDRPKTNSKRNKQQKPNSVCSIPRCTKGI